MPELPTGTVTFLFSDIEGSTSLLQHLGHRYADLLADHRQSLRVAFQAAGGHEVDTAGDGFFVAFQRATAAAAAATVAQDYGPLQLRVTAPTTAYPRCAKPSSSVHRRYQR